MKRYLILIIITAITMISVPLVMNKQVLSTVNEKALEDSTIPLETKESETTAAPENIAVFRSAQSTTENISMFEYVCGSVAAEMPLAYEEEALKAQAVACYTNALRQKSTQGNTENGDISDDSTVHQGYIDKAQRQKKWGKDFAKYEAKLQRVVKAVEGRAIYYDNELCLAAFHAISSGKTEDSENIWGTSVPYLKSVNSKGDKLSPQYASTVAFNKEDFIKHGKDLGVTTKSSLKGSIKITETSPTGTVLSATVCGKEYTGEEIRKAFSLRSPVFTVKATADAVTFSVSGYGHGVGLSQYGADYLARQGYTYDEILEHYYTDVVIK